MYFGIGYYISKKHTRANIDQVLESSERILSSEAQIIDGKLAAVQSDAVKLQIDHQAILSGNKKLNHNSTLTFGFADNGVYYKKSTGGSSLFYAATTTIGPKQKAKARLTETMDSLFEQVVLSQTKAVAAYFNSFDNMVRYYPYIDKVYDQFDPNITLRDFNFYYLADEEHNPERNPVWTKAYLDPAGKGWMISAIVPIYVDDFLEGVSGIDFTIESLIDYVLQGEIGPGGRMFLVDQDQTILAMPEVVQNVLGIQELTDHEYTEIINKTVEKPDQFRLTETDADYAASMIDLIAGKTRHKEVIIKGTSYYMLEQTIPSTQWSLMALIEKKKMLATITKLETFSLRVGYLAIALMVLFYLIFFIVLASRNKKLITSVAGPVNELSAHIAGFKLGADTVEIMTTDITELQHLSDSFQQMSETLNRQSQKIVTVEHEKQQKEELARNYQNLAERDPLTGLFNRKSVLDRVDQLMERYKDNPEETFSLIFIDVDHFKQVNDEHGHVTGDKVLTNLSMIMQKSIRANDILGRFGGEEFFIVAECTLWQAHSLAENLRRKIEHTVQPEDLKITASFGVTEVTPGDTIETLLERADQALYIAKGSGRNIVKSSEGS
jgi:diguanylate cyclase (GGDEF)-like protein